MLYYNVNSKVVIVIWESPHLLTIERFILMDSSLVRAVTEAEIAAYEHGGFVLLRNIYPQTWGDTLCATMVEVFACHANAKPISEGHADGEAKGAHIDIVKMVTAAKKGDILGLGAV